MITVDKAKGICEINGTGLELAMDIANIVANLCGSLIEHRKPGTSKLEAIKGAKTLLSASVNAGIASALSDALSGEESVPGGEDSNSAE